jgi:hypothetical protein
VISAFGSGERGARNDGINIAAESGAPFRAAAGGTVSYVGSVTRLRESHSDLASRRLCHSLCSC